jgi:DNA-binding transcriptional MerR regulator
MPPREDSVTDPDDIQKRYFSISEVADLLDVNTSVLRFWERQFREIAPRKGRNGRRLYSEKDVETLRIIHYLVKVRKFTLQGAREKLKMNPQDVLHTHQTRETLLEVRKFLVALRDAL